ncbi:hypothetical protein ACIBLA_15165 [Streptomyces sp. NPDC050433]|uniref:hypothetical protein n=1 Tax=Streptomyces sp. NPDC050433 TaxID=3365615 RepID=UPI00378EA1F3
MAAIERGAARRGTRVVCLAVLLAAFEEKHPRIDVRPECTQFADYVKSLKLTMASDTAPDIAQYAVGMDALAQRGGNWPRRRASVAHRARSSSSRAG